MVDFDPDAYLASVGTTFPKPVAVSKDPSIDQTQVIQFDPDQFLNKNGSIEKPEEESSLLEQAGTALEQGASGATLGLSKALETKGVPFLHIPAITTPEALASREHKYPGTSIVSNVVGTGAMLGLTGGLGSIAEGAGLSGRLGAAVIEGGTIGGINQATDDWSQNKPLDAQKIATSAGIGALLGLGGHAIVETARGATAGIGKSLNYFNNLAKGAASGEGVSSRIARSYIAAGEKSGEVVNDLVENLNGLYKSGKDAVKSMYEGSSQYKIGNALEGLELGDAKSLAQQTIDKIKSLIVPADAETAGNLSASSTKVVSKNLGELSSKLESAKSSLDVHNAMSDFATDLDKGIKFDKIPTAANQFDQEALRGLRGIIRGDLKNPEIWGNAAPIYEELSGNYSKYINSRKNFKRDFMKNRIAPNGQTIEVVDPTKVNTYFKNITSPGQKLRIESMDNFIDSSLNNAKYANEHGGFQKGLEDLEKQISNVNDFNGKAEILKQIKDAKTSHKAGLGLFASLEALPIPTHIKAAVLGLKRYFGSGGSYVFGSDLGHAANAASSLAKGIEKVNNRIEKGVKSIFTGSASESRKLAE